jgi:competence protein ComEC
MENRPLLIWVTVWVIGYVFAKSQWVPSITGYITVTLIVALFALMVFHIPHRMWLGAGCLFFIAIGYFQWQEAKNVSSLHEVIPMREESPSSEATLLGHIASSVTVDGDRASFVLEADELRFKDGRAFSMKRESVQVNVRLLEQREQEQVAHWRRGDTLTLSGTLRRPAEARNFGGFDYRQYLYRHHIYFQLSAKGSTDINWQQYTPNWEWIAILRECDQLRSRLNQQIDQIFNPEDAGLMKGMLIGDSSDLNPDRFQQFSELGLTHILAISGLNIAVFLGTLIWIMKKFRLRKSIYLMIAISLLPLYILLTGASPSVIRAGIMAMIVCFSERQHLQKDILHVLAIVAWGMLIWEPQYLWDVSFQLSFLVTAGLIIGVNRVNAILPISKPWLSNTIAVTLVSQVMSFPLSIYYFNQFSLLSGIANAALVPLISLIIYPAGLIALALSFVFMPIGQIIGKIIGVLNHIIFRITDELQTWRTFQLIWPSPSILWIIAFYLFCMTLYLSWVRIVSIQSQKNGLASQHAIPEWHSVTSISWLPWHTSYRIQQWMNHRFWASAFIALTLMFVIHIQIGYTPLRWNNYGQVQFIDVGQGDAILIRTPRGKHLLIDGGGTVQFSKPEDGWKARKDPYEVGKKLLVPLLKKRGVHQLDYVFLTHQDADHSGGLQAVFEQIPVKSVWFNGTYKPNKANQRLFETALLREIPLFQAEAKQYIQVEEGTSIRIIHPSSNSSETEKMHSNKLIQTSNQPRDEAENSIELLPEQNAFSLVFILEMEGTRWLFTGDIDVKAEQEILQKLKEETPMKIEVLKIAHHGSKSSTSEEWLSYFQPRIAVISVGATNRYGHPAKNIIDRLTTYHMQIFRTDQQGEIQFQVKDKQIDYRTKFTFE